MWENVTHWLRDPDSCSVKFIIAHTLTLKKNVQTKSHTNTHIWFQSFLYLFLKLGSFILIHVLINSVQLVEILVYSSIPCDNLWREYKNDTGNKCLIERIRLPSFSHTLAIFFNLILKKYFNHPLTWLYCRYLQVFSPYFILPAWA